MLKIFLITFLLLNIANGSNMVPVAKKNIGWKEVIDDNDIIFVSPNKKYSCKKYIDMTVLKSKNYKAKHFILKNRAICAKDVYTEQSKKIKFNFGMFEIEKEGELIKETDDYIKFRNNDGKIEKIYKDGNVK